MLRKIINGLKESGTLLNNFAWASSSKLFSIGLSFAVTPVLTRLYSPADYGLFSIFTILVSNYLIISNFSFQEALFVVKVREEFANLLVLSLLLILITIFPMAIIIPHLLSGYFNLIDYNQLWLFIVLCSFFWAILSVFQKITYYENRFRHGALIGVSHIAVNKFSALLFGIINKPLGLVYAEMSSKMVNLILHVFSFKKVIGEILLLVSKDGLRKVARDYINYPKYMFPAKYASIVRSQIPVWVLSYYFGIEVLGQFGLVNGLINLPVGLLGYAMQSAVMRRIRDQEADEIAILLRNLITRILVIVTPIVVLLAFTAKWWFVLILGEQWGFASKIASLMIFLIGFLIIEAITGGVYQVLKKEKQLIYYNFSYLLVYGLIVAVFYFLHMDTLSYIYSFVVVQLTLITIRNQHLMKMLNTKISLNWTMAVVVLVFLTWIFFSPSIIYMNY